jgi:hypothetical protein
LYTCSVWQLCSQCFLSLHAIPFTELPWAVEPAPLQQRGWLEIYSLHQWLGSTSVCKLGPSWGRLGSLQPSCDHSHRVYHPKRGTVREGGGSAPLVKLWSPGQILEVPGSDLDVSYESSSLQYSGSSSWLLVPAAQSTLTGGMLWYVKSPVQEDSWHNWVCCAADWGWGRQSQPAPVVSKTRCFIVARGKGKLHPMATHPPAWAGTLNIYHPCSWVPKIFGQTLDFSITLATYTWWSPREEKKESLVYLRIAFQISAEK